MRGRHAARKRAVDLLFEAEARGLTPAEVATSRAELARTQPGCHPAGRLHRAGANGVTEHAAHLDDLTASHLQGWTLDRSRPSTGRSCGSPRGNLLHAEDVPEPVAVDEAVKLAKELSTDDSPGFVNGVLGQVMLVTPQIRAASGVLRAPVVEPAPGVRRGQ